jgi:hypothetical protein
MDCLPPIAKNNKMHFFSISHFYALAVAGKVVDKFAGFLVHSKSIMILQDDYFKIF